METELLAMSHSEQDSLEKTKENIEGLEDGAVAITEATSSSENIAEVNVEVGMEPTASDGAKGQVFEKTETGSEVSSTTSEKPSVCGNCKEELGSVRLYWETDVFCSSECIEQYEDAVIGKLCSRCKTAIEQTFWQLNVIRVGNKALTFCSTKCKEYYGKEHQACDYCRIEITPEAKLSSLSPVNFGTQVSREIREKHFCSHKCYEAYKLKAGKPPSYTVKIYRCQGCLNYREFKTELTVFEPNQSVMNYHFCSSECMEQILKSRGVVASHKCPVCPTFVGNGRFASVSFYICSPHSIDVFCSERCKNLYFILNGLNRKVVTCGGCKRVDKCSVDMILRFDGGAEVERLYFCTVKCLRVYVNGLATHESTV